MAQSLNVTQVSCVDFLSAGLTSDGGTSFTWTWSTQSVISWGLLTHIFISWLHCCTSTKIHTLVGLNSAWIQREIHSFFKISHLTWVRKTHSGCCSASSRPLFLLESGFLLMDASLLSARGGRGASFNRSLLKILSSIYKKSLSHSDEPSGDLWRRVETGPTFHFGSSADPSGSVVTGCGLLLTVIPSLCWRHWIREGGSPADMRGVTKLKGEEKKTKKNKRKKSHWFFVRPRGWSRCRVREWPENLRRPAEPLPVWSEDEATVKPSSSRRSQPQCIPTPCCRINWGSEALEVANGLQKVASPPPSYTSRVTRWKFTAEELQRDQPKLEDAAPVRVSSHVQQGFSPQKLEGDKKEWIVLTDYKIKQQWRIYHIPILPWKT